MSKRLGVTNRPGPRGRCILALALVGATTSCAGTTTWQRLSAERGRDVPCLRYQVVDSKVPFYRAITICKTAKPDLTGDPQLQNDALTYNIPFTIRPRADADIKAFNHDQILDTGSHLPGPHPGLNLVGGIYE